MAEHFYSVYPEEAALMNYSFAVPHQHPHYYAQQQQPPLGHTRIADCVQNSISCAPSTQSNAQLADINNNNTTQAIASMRFYSNNNTKYCLNRSMPPPGMYDGYMHANAMVKMSAGLSGCGTGALLPSIENQNPLANGIAAAATAASGCHYAHLNGGASCYNRNRYMPYSHSRACAAAAAAVAAYTTGTSLTMLGTAGNATSSSSNSYQQLASIYQSCPNLMQPTAVPTTAPITNTSCSADTGYSTHSTHTHPGDSLLPVTSVASGSTGTSKRPLTEKSTLNTIVTTTAYNSNQSYAPGADPNQNVTLQITNLDYSMDEASLRSFLLNHLKPITPVISLVFEGSSFAKVTVPDLHFAKQVVSNLHRKKIGHKRMVVSYTRDSSLTEINTLRCQVAGLLKDVPYFTLPMYKFRELFQSRFKTSISVLDLYKMQDICTINSDNNEEKFISLQPELANSLENSPLMEGLQHSVPYCTIHFRKEQHKGWAEQDIEPLPNVWMTITEIQNIIYPLLKSHPGDIPVASLVHCIEGELSIQIKPHENGVNLEHLVCCVQGIQVQVNNFGIKILGWLELDKENGSTSTHGSERVQYGKGALSDPLYQISREVIELVKMSPKSTMKFNRFIPAYHNHFGKQCRVADYGYTKLIELFEALSSVVQIMGDGENRQITLTHRTQIRRFTSDLLRVMRAHGNKSVLLSQLPTIFAQTQNRNFDVSDYGVCDIVDILDGLVNSNVVVVCTVQNGSDILISIPKRKQTNSEIEKTSVFAGEMVELFRNAPQYTILFQKFVRSYHYHFAYQCRLSDYGFLKLADLMEAINGIVEMELTNDEDKKIFLSPIVARRVFSEQCEELICNATGSSDTCMKLSDVLELHKKKFGYQIQSQTLGVEKMSEAIDLLPYVELLEKDDCTWIICHNEDTDFRNQCYRVVKYILAQAKPTPTNPCEDKDLATKLTISEFTTGYKQQFLNGLPESTLRAMKHAIQITTPNDGEEQEVQLTNFMKFLLSIVRVLKQRPSVMLHELKAALSCKNSTTFEFGFPNLYSVLVAYSDVFAITMGISQERSGVSLQPGTELALAQTGRHHLFGSLKLPLVRLKPATRIPRAPLVEVSMRQGKCVPPAESHDQPTETTSIPVSLSPPDYRSQNSLSLMYEQSVRTQLPSAEIKSFPPPSGFQSKFNGSSFYTRTSHQSATLNSSTSNSNKENSFNSSINIFNSSLNSSNTSLSELNSSVGAPHLPSTAVAKLWDRRQSAFYRANQITLDSNTCQPAGILPLIIPPTHPALIATVKADASQQEMLFSQQQQRKPPLLPIKPTLYDFDNNTNIYPLYEPPKPDTPPCDNMPFWIDPIWSNNQTIIDPPLQDNLLNIKLPEMKSLNVLPMLLSPYTLSKFENMKQQSFNFENHDRKIA